MEKNVYQPGIYCLKADKEKLIYIGSSKNMGIRRNLHKSHIKKRDRVRGCIQMIEAVERGNNISFEVIEFTSDLINKEQYYINLFRNTDQGFIIVNTFDAERDNSGIQNSFRNKMSIAKGAHPDYKKNIHIFKETGEYLNSYYSTREAAKEVPIHNTTIAYVARGVGKSGYRYQSFIIVNSGVLSKLDELLETHQELRAISSQAWKSLKSTMKVQRLIGEQTSNKPNTSVRQSKFALDFD